MVVGPLRAAVPVADTASAPVILVYGDSLSAGYGIRVEQGWVALLGRKLAQEGYVFRVVNASASGETTAGGAARLAHTLDTLHPRILILELGGNDGLRGLPIAGMRANLERMLVLARDRGVRVLMLGIRIPPNYGERYTREFQQPFADLTRKYGVALVPFLLEGVALTPGLMQADGIHPNEQGQPVLLDNVWQQLAPMLRPTRVRHAHAGGR